MLCFLRVIKVDQLDEDSSYDSDTEAVNSPHPNGNVHQGASRNVSETLRFEQELEDFSSVSILFFLIPSSSIPDLKQNIEIVVVSLLSSHTLRRFESPA